MIPPVGVTSCPEVKGHCASAASVSMQPHVTSRGRYPVPDNRPNVDDRCERVPGRRTRCGGLALLTLWPAASRQAVTRASIWQQVQAAGIDPVTCMFDEDSGTPAP